MSRWTPEGDPAVPCVAAGNLMLSRCVLLAHIASALNISWVIEQPSSSIMLHHSRMQWLVERVSTYQIGGIFMGAYGGSSRKPLTLDSNEKWIERLCRPLPAGAKFENQETATRYIDSRGQRKVTGGTRLKETQAYPPEFGDAFGEIYAENQREPDPPSQPQTVAFLKRMVNFAISDAWDDAKLGEVAAYLSR